MPLPIAVAAAALAGALLDAAFPEQAIWPLAFAGVGLLLTALRGRSVPGGLLVGFVSGAAFYFLHIQWASLFLGPLPMSALAILQALFFAGGAGAISVAYRWIPSRYARTSGRLVVLPATVAGIWTLREAIASTWPYGGFSWGRLSMSQADGPFAELFSWVGISGLTFLMVGVVSMSLEVARTRAGRTRAVVPIALISALAAVPPFPVGAATTLRVAAVQGNGPAGYFDSRDDGDLLAAQMSATAPLFGQAVDLVVWPEGSTDRNPLADPATAAALTQVAAEMSAPLIGWGVTERDGKTFNSAILWDADAGPLDYYDKRHPVPFGEYVPDRAFWQPFAPDLIDLVQREYTPGSTDSIFDVDGTPIGVNICFDIVDDNVLRGSVIDGAQLIVSSSNNADFGRTDESEQQLAIARIRALELGRSVINVSTVGITAVIAPDGTVRQRLPWYTAGTIVADVPLADGLTPAALVGGSIELTVAIFGAASLLIAIPQRGKAHHIGPNTPIEEE